MGFWRDEVITPSLDGDTLRLMREQIEWIEREPANALPYYHLAQFYRTQQKQDEALGLLLEAARLNPALAPAHVSLAEIYAIRGDYTAAWRHAREAEAHGDPDAVELLARHNVPGRADHEPM
jgi:tetratricopeptide (TPR) repeat protein